MTVYDTIETIINKSIKNHNISVAKNGLVDDYVDKMVTKSVESILKTGDEKDLIKFQEKIKTNIKNFDKLMKKSHKTMKIVNKRPKNKTKRAH